MNLYKHSAAIFLCITMASCVQQGLEPEEVLRKTVIANQDRESANFTLDATLSNRSSGGQIEYGADIFAEGVMQDGGNQLDFAIEISSLKELPASWSVKGDVRILGENEVYVNLRDVSFEEDQLTTLTDAAQVLDLLKNTWWKIPTNTAASSTDIAPDPQLLGLQSESIAVTRNHGIVHIDGVDLYHYNVSVGQEKLIKYLLESDSSLSEQESDVKQFITSTAISGELWIDAKTFYVQKAQWNIVPKSEEGTTIGMTISLSDQIGDKRIEPPVGAADLPIDLQQLLTIPSSS